MSSPPRPLLIDSHAHLTMRPLGENIAAVLDRARAAGVGHVLTVGTSVAETRDSLAMAERFPGLVSAAGGVHPHEASGWDRQVRGEFARLAERGGLRALGETGLDFHYDHSPRPAQEAALLGHLALSRETGLPLIVHLRDRLDDARGRSRLDDARGQGRLEEAREGGAYERALAICEREGAPPAGGVIHCFSGTLEQARRFLALGFSLSLSGTITFPSRRSMTWNREVLALLPLDRLLVETDCPYLAPHPNRGRTNEPALVALTVDMLAGVMGIAPADAARVTARNAARLFRLPLALPPSAVAYPIRASLYLNVTSLCPNTCAYCRREKDPVVKGHDLSLPCDPSAEAMLAALEAEGWRDREEVVFCGYGEPTCRLGEVLKTARRLKELGAKRVRLNTNGQGSLLAGEDIVPRFRGLIDAVSISLAAQDEDTYSAVCRPTLGPGPHAAVLAFARACVRAGIETTLTAVPWPGVDLAACRALAESMGARFRVRPLDEVG
jgi:TatD DNase family protein